MAERCQEGAPLGPIPENKAASVPGSSSATEITTEEKKAALLSGRFLISMIGTRARTHTHAQSSCSADTDSTEMLKYSLQDFYFPPYRLVFWVLLFFFFCSLNLPLIQSQGESSCMGCVFNAADGSQATRHMHPLLQQSVMHRTLAYVFIREFL